MKVELLHATPICILIRGARTCYDSNEKSDSELCKNFLGENDLKLTKTLIEQGHTSVLEHCAFNFSITDISRGCLQELARHRMASLSVRSTRYTLGRIKHEEPFVDEDGRHRAAKYLVWSAVDWVNYSSVAALEEVRQGALAGIPNDQLKYMLPESFKTSLVWTINARSLRNFLELRLSRKAHWEISKLAQEILNALPREYSLLFEDVAATHIN